MKIKEVLATRNNPYCEEWHDKTTIRVDLTKDSANQVGFDSLLTPIKNNFSIDLPTNEYKSHYFSNSYTHNPIYRFQGSYSFFGNLWKKSPVYSTDWQLLFYTPIITNDASNDAQGWLNAVVEQALKLNNFTYQEWLTKEGQTWLYLEIRESPEVITCLYLTTTNSQQVLLLQFNHFFTQADERIIQHCLSNQDSLFAQSTWQAEFSSNLALSASSAPLRAHLLKPIDKSPLPASGLYPCVFSNGRWQLAVDKKVLTPTQINENNLDVLIPEHSPSAEQALHRALMFYELYRKSSTVEQGSLYVLWSTSSESSSEMDELYSHWILQLQQKTTNFFVIENRTQQILNSIDEIPNETFDTLYFYFIQVAKLFKCGLKKRIQRKLKIDYRRYHLSMNQNVGIFSATTGVSYFLDRLYYMAMFFVFWGVFVIFFVVMDFFEPYSDAILFINNFAYAAVAGIFIDSIMGALKNRRKLNRL